MEVVEQITKTNIDAIDLLESVKNKIENGEITAISISWVTNKGAIGGDFSNGNSGILMWASIEHAAKSFYEQFIK